MKKLLLALPKGRILEELKPALQKGGIIPEPDFFDESSRKLIFQTNLDFLEITKVRSFDVATFVKFGAADLGICGLDVLEEFPSNEIFRVVDLKIGKCRLSLASAKNKNIDPLNLHLNSHARIATKYPNLVSAHFANLGIQAEIIKLNGAIEIAQKLGLCDFIVDLVSSGKTLVENNMIELQKILEVSSYLVVNRTSFKVSNQQINHLVKLFDV